MNDKYENIDPIYQKEENANENQYRSYPPTYNTAPPRDVDYRETEGPVPNQTKKKTKRSFPRFVALFVVFIFLGGITFGAGYSTALYLGDQLTPSLIQSQAQKLTFDVNQIEPVVSSNSTLYESTNLVSSIAKTAGPSVVTITSSYLVNQNNFFNSQTFEREGTGSGIIYKLRNDDLLIITNHHVIADANGVEVTFSDNTHLPGDIIGYDSRNDLAVISVSLEDIDNSDLSDITVATFGDSEALEVGELAVAIGNPLGKEFSNTVTAGVVSAVNREITISETSLTLIQTDAAINPGNSGGALVNSNGEVIGINTAKYVNESVEGMGFAIPVHIGLPVIETIIENGSGEDVAYAMNDDKPFLGVQISDINEQIYNETGMPFGIYVTEVYENSAAANAGVEAGDVIYSLNGQKLMNTDDLFDALSDKAVGDVIKLSVARGDQVLNLEAQLTRYGDVITE
jgi:serine protease Do